MTTESPTPPHSDIAPVHIEEEMRRSYLDYAMSVIVSRALPDARDGLKPVHRRILFAMNEENYHWNRPYRKSARIVGDVMGKYHPHGDTAIYDAMVRMAQDFSMRLMLVDGQGNFGSMDGDPPAAMRYTEVRMARAAHELLGDIDKDTVDFHPNYDETTQEPAVLPARFPNLLVNGAGGIAVGMATNIPPHNLGEVIDAVIAMIDDPDISLEAVMEFIQGPDFPTGGIILGRSGILSAYRTGRGSVVIRGAAEITEIRRDRMGIVVTEIPYQVNKAKMIERIAELVREKRIEGISDIRDESDRDGVRVVVELKRDANPQVVLNQLYRFSTLQTTFGVNMLALDHGQPRLMTLRESLAAFIAFREDVITRRTIHELGKARDRAHVLAGLSTAVANIDEVIALIRGAPDPQTAREQLMARDWPAGEVEPLIRLIDEPGRGVVDGRYRLSEAQARAILELRLQRLTGLERDKIAEEIQEIAVRIRDYLDILASRDRVMTIMRDELTEMRAQYADPRRSVIEDSELDQDIEDLIQEEDMVVTVTHGGYIKRVALSTYRAQRRGGKGLAGMSMRENDFVSQLYVCSTHTALLFFSSRGIVYKLKVYRLPEGTRQARGKALVNLLPLQAGETITTVLPLPEDAASRSDLFLMLATAQGNVRRNLLADFVNVMVNGKIAMKLDDGDRLVGAAICAEDHDILLTARRGNAIRFPVPDVRVFSGRTSPGVRGIRLGKGDEVVSMSVLCHVELAIERRDAYLRVARRRDNGEANGEEPVASAVVLSEDEVAALAEAEEFVLTVTERGFGKRTSAYEYRITNRGGQGIANIEMTDRNGAVVAAFPVGDADQIMLVTDGGQLIRCPVHDIRIAGRRTQGVTLFKTAADERVVSVAHVAEEENGEAEAASGEPAPA